MRCYQYILLGMVSLEMPFFPSIGSNSVQSLKPWLCPISSMAILNLCDLLSEVSHSRNDMVSLSCRWLFFGKQVRRTFIDIHRHSYWERKWIFDRFKQVQLGVLNHKCYIEGLHFLDIIANKKDDPTTPFALHGSILYPLTWYVMSCIAWISKLFPFGC